MGNPLFLIPPPHSLIPSQSIIKGWLDPVVANKIHFTKSITDLEKFIPRNQLLSELEGEEDWTFKYIEPEPGENAAQADTATRDRLAAERKEVVKKYEENTRAWIKEASTGGS